MTNPYDKAQPETIQKMFGAIAHNYDRANAILSLGLHRYWNNSLVKNLSQNTLQKGWLDLCAGTGDIAFTFLKKQTTPQKAILIDFCPEMLAYAKEKGAGFKHHLQYIQADVQQLPLESGSVSVASMAYGIRNVKDPLKCFQETFRILEPQGLFGILELTQPKSTLLRGAHRLYLSTALPILGKWLTSNREAYQYLCNSIQHFVPPATLEKMLLEAGFKRVEIIPLTFGTATLLLGYKS